MIKKLLLCSLALFLTLLTHAQNVPSYVPTNGLVGWWPFNGNANDESGNGNNGTVNGATLGLDRNGNSNAAYQFDGNGDYIDVNDNPALRLANSNYTVQLWAKFNTFANQDLIRKDNAWSGSGTTNGYAFTTANTNNLFVWHWPANTGPIYSMSASTWYHIVYIYDTSTQTFKLFVNSVLTSTQNLAPVSATSVNDKMRIGGGWTNWWHNGAIDDIGYWNRALTQQEITNLYNSSLPTAYCPTLPSNLQSGLVGYWPFCGNANDASGNGNNGFVYSATSTTDRFGNTNRAYDFNGSTSRILIPDAPHLNNDYTSISIWFQSSSTSLRCLYYKTDLNAYNEQYACGINFGQSNRTEIALKNGNNCQSPGNGWIRTATYLNVSDGEWHNLIFSYDGAICKMYIDGILTATGNFNQGVIDHCGGELNIGTAYNLGNPFLGKIDDIAIWNRALSSSEVAQLYAAQSVNPNSIASSTPTVATNFPSGIAYQAVARDSTGQPIGNSAIGVRFSIRDSSLSGTVVYSETHNLTTNALGLFTATIGNGTAQSGTYAGINWMGPVKLLQVEVNAGSGYQLIGGQQLLSVPYANAANAAAKIKNSGLPVFPDNTSALSGGLQPGDTYRTPTGILMIVY